MAMEPVARGMRESGFEIGRPHAAREIGIVKATSWSDFDICVANLTSAANKAAGSVVEAKTAAASKAVVGSGVEAKMEAAGKAAAGSGVEVKTEAAAGSGVEAKTAARKTRLVEVGQHYIDLLLQERAVNPIRRFPARSPERIARFYSDKPEIRDEILSSYAKYATVFKKGKERDEEILRQYDAEGSAYLEIDED